MMAAILNSAMLDSATAILDWDTLLSSLMIHSKQNWIWLKLIQSDSNSFILTSTWWCQPSWILPSWIQPFWTNKNFTHSFSLNLMMSAILNSAILDCSTSWFSHLLLIHSDSTLAHLEATKKTSLIHSDSTWWWQPSWILGHVGFSHCHLGLRHLVIFSQDSLKNTLTPLWLWLKLIQSDSNSFILT